MNNASALKFMARVYGAVFKLPIPHWNMQQQCSNYMPGCHTQFTVLLLVKQYGDSGHKRYTKPPIIHQYQCNWFL